MSKSNVYMLGGPGPNVAHAFIDTTVANGDGAGFVVVAVDEHGNVDLRVFGDVPRYSLAFAAAKLLDYSVHGEFEPPKDPP